MIIDLAKTEAEKNKTNQVTLYTIRETGNVDVFIKFGFKVIIDEITDDFVSEKYDALHEVYMALNLN